MDDLIWTPYPVHNAPVLFDARGHRRTGSLFSETTQDKNRHPVLTLKDYDNNGMLSAYQLYMTSADEYDAAMKMVGSMTHWRKLMSSSWFMTGDPDKNFTGLESWRKDMQARDASTAKKLLLDKVKEGDRQAAQYLMTYATKGDTAGLVQKTKKSPKDSRRGSQNRGDVINLDQAFSKLMEGDTNGC